MAMRFQNRFFSTLQSVFCARFHVARGPASSLDCQLPSPSEYAADRRLEIFFEQQKQPWNALKKLDADMRLSLHDTLEQPLQLLVALQNQQLGALVG